MDKTTGNFQPMKQENSSENISNEDYARIAQAIEYLENNFREQPTLEDISKLLHLSPFYTQRLFKRWAGITPKRFVQYLTLQHAQKLLANSHSVLDTALDSGLSGTSRLHDLFVNIEAVTPAEYKRMGAGLQIEYGYHPSPFGECLLAKTERGICGLWFTDTLGREATLAELAKKWPGAKMSQNDAETAPLAQRIFAAEVTKSAELNNNQSGKQNQPINLLIRGTNFQIQVWEALLRIPTGSVCTYGDIAKVIDRPNAVRAVGSAVGKNEIAWLIPCHRVIRKDGSTENYRWGKLRKKAILIREWGSYASDPAVALTA
jgi:AraC family transcriptional regulator of adaptative response/methylated-DNA-[protein]-cysteine methyltransferase